MHKNIKVLIFGLTLIALLGLPASADWDVGDGHKMHFPQLPDEVGWDVACMSNLLADDWQCSQSGVVDDIHFWGSWQDIDGDHIGDVGNIVAFHILIYSDLPADQNPDGYSKPDSILRDWVIDPTMFQMRAITPPPQYMEGWYDPCISPPNNVWYNDHNQYFQYNIVGLSTLVDDPFVQDSSTIYWLAISASVEPGSPQPQWGWKTSTWHFNDDAVAACLPDFNWIELYEPARLGTFNVGFDTLGQFVSGGGSNYYSDNDTSNGWYYYENTNWWNIWFYDNPPSLERKKTIHIQFLISQWFPDTIPGFFQLAVNYSTPEWPPGGPPPLPPLPPEQESLFVARDILIFDFPVLANPQTVVIDTVIEWFNPEWVSIDVMGENFIIEDGEILHECVDRQTGDGQSLDLAFVITGEAEEFGACCYGDPYAPSCLNTTQSYCIDSLGGTWYDGGDCTDPAFVCPALGACCFADGSCNDMLQTDCQTIGGIWGGVGSQCLNDNDGNLIDDACEGYYPLGACCLSNDSCIVTYEQACNTVPGATFMGNGTDCNDNDGNGLPDICEEPDSLLKWQQLPDLDSTGMDVSAYWYPDYPYLLADDFPCWQTGPITEIVIWGSWWQDRLPDASFSFILSFHTDIPAALNPNGNWSMPGDLLWLDTLQATDQILYAAGLNEGWFEPPSDYQPLGDTQCWMYRFTDFNNPFFQQGSLTDTIIYWLDVQVLTAVNDTAYFGWKTSIDHWNDDAVWIMGEEPLGPPPQYWRELRYPLGHPWYEQSIDLSFALYGYEAEPDTGACCFPDGSCLVLTQADCVIQGGTWAGANTSCLNDTDNNLIDDACEGLYPLGACCFTDQSCVVTYQAACNNVAGAQYMGDGTDCSDGNTNGIADICETPPDSGACCLSDGSCSVITQADCDNQGGTWNGAGTSCAGDGDSNLIDDNCENLYPLGACCFEDQTCVVTYEDACNTVATAQYMGDGTDCSDADTNSIADICEEEPIDTCDYYKPPYPDYAPAGVPDFDQKQDGWFVNIPNPPVQQWTYCGPVALANCLWWFDSKFQYILDPSSPPPPTFHDDYSLVQSYDPAGVWDDHDTSNVIPFVDSLAAHCNTDTSGTLIWDMQTGAQNWINNAGLGADYTVSLYAVGVDTGIATIDFEGIRQEVLRSQNVILLLGFYHYSEPYCERIGGHYVTVAGTCTDLVDSCLCLSDPFFDRNELGPPPPHGSNVHNDAQFVSGPHGTMHHDGYDVLPVACQFFAAPFFFVELAGYPINPGNALNFYGQNPINTFDPILPQAMPIRTVIEYALIICPAEPDSGACCFPDGSCLELTEADCDSSEGIWSGAGTTCLGDGDSNLIDDACEDLYPVGACCYEDQTCVVTYEDACNLVSGATYMGDGTDCTDGDGNSIADICEEPPPDGACCFPDGSCAELSEADCDTEGGIWSGAGTTCLDDGDNNLIDDQCEDLYPVGACCFEDQTCVVTYEDACNLVSGATYMGDGTDCTDGDGNSIADICEEPTGFNYLPGDANMPNGLWPPAVIGADVTYLVNYFRGIGGPCLLYNPTASIAPPYFYAAADANGDCLVIGSDVTRLVTYFRGLVGISWCSDFPPGYPPVPPNPPAGWPGCQTPPVTGKTVIPTESEK